MHQSVPGFSILVPVKGGMPYLNFCVRSVLTQKHPSFELVVSVEQQESEALSFLNSVGDPRLRVVHPPSGLSMMEHWDWVQKKARGQWQMFLGQDDGIQSHFFELAEKLVRVADANSLRTIVTRRAFLHWAGASSDRSGNGEIHRLLSGRLQVRDLHKDARAALVGSKSYFELPQMYTCSLFKAELIVEARGAQGGDFLTCHPQDANLAAIATALETKYLYCGIPLGWVGSSPKSAGAAISSLFSQGRLGGLGVESLAKEYASSVASSRFPYPDWAGEFSLAIPRIYFWQSLRQTGALQNSALLREIQTEDFVRNMLAKSWSEIRNSGKRQRRKQLRRIMELHGIKTDERFLSRVLFSEFVKLFLVAKRVLRVVLRLMLSNRSILVGFKWESSRGARPSQAPFSSGLVPLPHLDISRKGSIALH